jgi:hypothetical protein
LGLLQLGTDGGDLTDLRLQHGALLLDFRLEDGYLRGPDRRSFLHRLGTGDPCESHDQRQNSQDHPDLRLPLRHFSPPLADFMTESKYYNICT